jgi:hypothetical protein
MPLGSRFGPYADYAWKTHTSIKFNVPAKSAGRVVKYRITPTVEWTATPKVLRFRVKRKHKQGTLFWTLS